jgi:hypothetical protein
LEEDGANQGRRRPRPEENENRQQLLQTSKVAQTLISFVDSIETMPVAKQREFLMKWVRDLITKTGGGTEELRILQKRDLADLAYRYAWHGDDGSDLPGPGSAVAVIHIPGQQHLRICTRVPKGAKIFAFSVIANEGDNMNDKAPTPYRVCNPYAVPLHEPSVVWMGHCPVNLGGGEGEIIAVRMDPTSRAVVMRACPNEEDMKAHEAKIGVLCSAGQGVVFLGVPSLVRPSNQLSDEEVQKLQALLENYSEAKQVEQKGEVRGGAVDAGSGDFDFRNKGKGTIVTGDVSAKTGIEIHNNQGEGIPSVTNTGNIQAGKQVKLQNNPGGNRTSFSSIKAGGNINMVTGDGVAMKRNKKE